MEYIEPAKIPYFGDCEPLVKGLGFQLVELVAFKRQSTWHVRLVITGSEGFGIKECTTVHRAILPRLEAILDSQDMYVEVTSPGLDRVFKNATEFSVFSGKQVKVWDTDIKDWVQGTILSADSQAVTLSTGKGEITVPYARIAKAKLNNA